jgi:hypothetical protein
MRYMLICAAEKAEAQVPKPEMEVSVLVADLLP